MTTSGGTNKDAISSPQTGDTVGGDSPEGDLLALDDDGPFMMTLGGKLVTEAEYIAATIAEPPTNIYTEDPNQGNLPLNPYEPRGRFNPADNASEDAQSPRSWDTGRPSDVPIP